MRGFRIDVVRAAPIIFLLACDSAVAPHVQELRVGDNSAALQAPGKSIHFKQDSVVLGVGHTARLTLRAGDSQSARTRGNGPRRGTWETSSSEIADVDSNGLVTAKSIGQTIIAVDVDGVRDSITVNVVADPVRTVRLAAAPNSSLGVGASYGMEAVAEDAAGDVLPGRVISWTSSDSAVATVSDDGMVTAMASGSALITAESEGITASTDVEVTATPSNALVVILSPDTLSVGQSVRAKLVGSDSSNILSPGQLPTWVSSNPSVATITFDGLIVGVSPGTAVIRGTFNSQQGEAPVTVVVPALPTAPVAPSTGTGIEPAAPRTLVTTVAATPSAGRTLHVSAGGNLQAALDSAVAGDKILLAAGASFTGNFVLRAKPAGSGLADGWITVTSDGPLPPEGTRMTPSAAAGLALPKLVSATILPVLSAPTGAARWRLQGLEVTTAAGLTSNQGLVVLGDGNASAPPRNLVLDRLYVHGTPTLDVRRCIALNSDSTAVIDSYVSECHSLGFDAQAAWGWDGNGPFKLVNNYLEASTEVVGFGGADPAIANLVPSDIEIRGNHITRPMSWKGGPWLVKNLVELKSARRVAITGNVLENSWPQAQLGWAFVLWSVNQQGTCTWCGTTDVLVADNLIRNVAAGFQLSDKYGVAVPMQRLAIRNNVLLGVDNPDVVGGGYGFLIQGGIQALSIEHNTVFVPTTSSLQWYNTGLLTNHIVRNNLTGGGKYPLWMSPTNSWSAVAGTGTDFGGNVVALGADFGSTFPANNMYPATLDAVGLVGGGSAAYSVSVSPSALSLLSTSLYKGKATDGRDPGADINAILAATAGAVIAP